MRMVPVKSSAITQVGYDEQTSTLRILFRAGFAYEFYVVPRRVFEAFLEAESKGRFFDEELRDGPYSWRRLEESS